MVNELTDRQSKILNWIVRDYIDTAQAIGSEHLDKKHKTGLSPATLRNEMQKLTDKGFLSQPHTSAGRIPTDKGYRFFVNNLISQETKEKENINIEDEFDKLTADWFEEEIGDTFKFVQSITKHIAQTSGALTLNYLEKENIFWKEGWEEVLEEPEFEERDYLLNFTDFLRRFEDNIGEIKNGEDINVYIGKENLLPKSKDFSVISSHYHLPSGEEGIISLLGPKRMEYDRNINLINSLIKLLEDF